jgi:uncharacterized protein
LLIGKVLNKEFPKPKQQFKTNEIWRRLRQKQEQKIRNTPGKNWNYRILLTFLTTILHVCGLYRRGKRNALTVNLKKCDLLIPSLPIAFDGYQILHLTDLHIDAQPEIIDVVVDLLTDVKADLCVMTGDYRESHFAAPEEYLPHLERLLDHVNCADGVLATLGNHDTISAVPKMASAGVNVLGNQSIKLFRKEDHLTITGVDDPSFFFSDMAIQALEKNPGSPKILLAHSPEMAVEAAQAGYHLYLAGHTHGGQIALPGGRPILTRLSKCKNLAVGEWEVEGMKGYTSCGVGVGSPTVRFNTRGEVTIFTLKTKNL